MAISVEVLERLANEARETKAKAKDVLATAARGTATAMRCVDCAEVMSAKEAEEYFIAMLIHYNLMFDKMTDEEFKEYLRGRDDV